MKQDKGKIMEYKNEEKTDYKSKIYIKRYHFSDYEKLIEDPHVEIIDNNIITESKFLAAGENTPSRNVNVNCYIVRYRYVYRKWKKDMEILCFCSFCKQKHTLRQKNSSYEEKEILFKTTKRFGYFDIMNVWYFLCSNCDDKNKLFCEYKKTKIKEKKLR